MITFSPYFEDVVRWILIMTVIGNFSFIDLIPLISFDQIVFTSLLLCFGAGVLLCTALLHIMPEVFVVTIVFAFVFVLVFILVLVFVFVLAFVIVFVICS